jgi:flagellar assembly protein FliH
MPLIRQSNRHEIARDAVVLDLGDLRRQADALKQHALDEAQALREQGAIERERLIAGGREQGFAEGRVTGLAEGRAAGLAEGRAQALAEHNAALTKLEKSWEHALRDFSAARDEMLEQAKIDVIRLAIEVANKITRNAAANSAAICAQLEDVLKAAARATKLVILIHPEDEAFARQALPALIARLAPGGHAEITSENSVPRGTCVARCGVTGARIDASIETQLARIADALLPRRAAEENSA